MGIKTDKLKLDYSALGNDERKAFIKWVEFFENTPLKECKDRFQNYKPLENYYSRSNSEICIWCGK